jgi:hypothetical protein
MAAKRKKTKRTSKVNGSPHDGQHDGSPPPAHGPADDAFRGRAGVGRGQGAAQTRRYAFRRS